LVCIGNENAGQNGFIFYIPGSTTTLSLYTNGTAALTTSSGSIALNTWHHVALVRSGTGAGNTVIYVDGVSKGSAQITTSFTGIAANGLCIGQTYNGSFVGVSNTYISNVRLVKGSPVYTGAFTPPTSPLTAITNTVLLTCQSNRFVDTNTQTTAKTITVTGSPSVTPFSPFAPTSSYSAAAVGGSGYFDGTGDYLSVADNTALDMEASDFTMECWVYLNETPSSSDGIFAKRTDVGTFGGVLIYFSGLTPNFYATLSGSSWGIAFSSSIAATLNAWTHLAFTRSGSTWTIYVNGVSGGTGNSSGTVPNNTSAFVVGAYSSDGNATYLFPAGYISNVRVVKGTAIVPPAGGPTAPLTAVPNTSLLLNFTNAGITDATAKNVLETVGNAQISTSVSKFGGGSMYFDGTGDYLVAPNSPLLDQIGDFTHEMWYYRSGNGAAGQFDVCFYKDITNYLYMVVDRNNSYKACIVKHNIGFIITGTTALASATWYHLAFSRSGSTVRLFVNGVLDGSATESTNTSGSAVSYFGGSAGHTFNGYIDDMRITRGYARYTANFTPPTAPFPVQ
jgi:hypothetical protein